MRERKRGHRQRRSKAAGGFENHALSEGRHADTGAGKGARAWRFFDVRSFWHPHAEGHFRLVARTPALPGKHFRTVEEPVKSPHGKSDH